MYIYIRYYVNLTLKEKAMSNQKVLEELTARLVGIGFGFEKSQTRLKNGDVLEYENNNNEPKWFIIKKGIRSQINPYSNPEKMLSLL